MPVSGSFGWASSLLAVALLAGCDGGAEADGGADAARPDAAADRDAGARHDAAPADGGPPDAAVAPTGEMALGWVRRVESAGTLAEASSARLAPAPHAGVVLSVPLGAAPATFAPDRADALTLGDGAAAPPTQALAWLGADGSLEAARAVAVDDPAMEGFDALGLGLDTLADGTVVVAGSFLAGARFGGDDPDAVSFQTVREMLEMDRVVTSREGYLARFDADRAIAWAARARSETGLADLRLADVAALPDGSTIGIGAFDDPVTLGQGADEARLTPTAGSEGEVFVARHGPDGSLTWARRLEGTSTPVRVAAWDDGAFAVLFRYSAAVTVGPGEAAERTLPDPPDGVLAWDAVARFDADGRLAWVRAVGSGATTHPGLQDLWLAADGAVVVAGTFRGQLAWPDEPDVDPLRIYGVDGVLARLDADGGLAWQHRIRSLRSLKVQAIAPTAAGGTWVALTVGPDGAVFMPEGEEPLFLMGTTDNARLVLLRYDAAGVLRAAQHLATTDVDADDLLPVGDALVLVGRYGAGTVLEPGTTAARRLPDARSYRNVFVARYAPR